MSADRVLLVHPEFGTHDPFEPGRSPWSSLRWDHPEEARRIIEEGRLIVGGSDLSPTLAKRVRARLLGTYVDRPAAGYAPEVDGRWLIPDLWRWGHKPMLTGQPRAGKSTLVADLAASLLQPGRRFLDHYEPAAITDAERGRGVWLINAENPEPELSSLIGSTGLVYWADDLSDGGRWYREEEDSEGWLMIDHLEAIGGASSFDLRDPRAYDWWANRIMDVSCEVCDGQDEQPPLAVIVDGVTAILGSDTTGYGEWYAAFRRLMHELDVPNALVVVHSPMNGGEAMNGVESIAGADGTWKYTMSNVHDPKSARTFSGSRRLIRGGIEGGRVVPGEGRTLLRLAAAVPREEPEPAGDPLEAARATVLDRLTRAGAGGLSSTDLTGRGREGGILREARDALVAEDLIVSKPNGLGQLWFLAEYV